MIRAFLVAAVLLSLLSGLTSAQEQQPAAAEGKPVSRPDDAKHREGVQDGVPPENAGTEKLAPAILQVETAVSDPISQERKSQSKHPSKYETRQLQAQEDMVFWAMLMFFATVATVALTSVGILLIWRTLHHTRRAADHAQDMVVEAQKTTDAAQEANAAAFQSAIAAQESVEVSRQSAERQLRAYLLTDQISFIANSDNLLWVGVVFKNTGQTPAHNVRARVHCAIARTADGNYPFRVELGPTFGTVGPGQEFTGRFFQPDGNDFANSTHLIALGDAEFFVWGAAEYVDVFGTTQTTQFRYRYSIHSDDFVPCDEGNEAT